MSLRGVGVTALTTVAAWGVWDWASSNGHSTIGLVAGVLLVPSAVALAGFLALALLAAGRSAAQRVVARRARSRNDLTPRGGGASSPPAAPRARGRIAA
jgi:hypothetical protein